MLQLFGLLFGRSLPSWLHRRCSRQISELGVGNQVDDRTGVRARVRVLRVAKDPLLDQQVGERDVAGLEAGLRVAS